MPGDYSNSQHVITWKGDVQTQDGEIIFPGDDTAFGEIADSADWILSGDFTIELFGLKTASETDRQTILAQFQSVGDLRSFLLRWEGDSSPKKFTFFLSTDGTAGGNITLSGDFSMTANQAYDVTVERSGTTARLYVDGSMIASGTMSGAAFDSSRPVVIGKTEHTTNPWNGRLKAVRIDTANARYADDNGYTVPALPLPTSA